MHQVVGELCPQRPRALRWEGEDEAGRARYSRFGGGAVNEGRFCAPASLA